MGMTIPWLRWLDLLKRVKEDISAAESLTARSLQRFRFCWSFSYFQVASSPMAWRRKSRMLGIPLGELEEHEICFSFYSWGEMAGR